MTSGSLAVAWGAGLLLLAALACSSPDTEHDPEAEEPTQTADIAPVVPDSEVSLVSEVTPSEMTSPETTPPETHEASPEPSSESINPFYDVPDEIGGERIVHLGGDIEPPRKLDSPTDERLSKKIFELSRANSWRTCIFRCAISSTGEVVTVEMLRPRDADPEIRALYEELLSERRFEPAREAGRPVAVWYFLTINHCPVYPRASGDD